MALAPIQFCKMFSAGQDFVVLDARRWVGCNLSEYAVIACNRVNGIGADALVAIENSNLGDFKLSAFNSNGCLTIGDNGIRCAARYIYEQQLIPSSYRRFSVETSTQSVEVEIIGKGDRVRINMGRPVFAGNLIPTLGIGEQLNKSINVDGTVQQICAVGMGGAHCILFRTGIDYLDTREIGSRLEKHVYFPNGCTVDFSEIVDPELIKVRIWQKGQEQVVAFGNSCCAVAAAAIRTGVTARRLIVRTAAGELELLWDDNDADIFLTGSVDVVYTGEMDVEGYVAEKTESILS